MCKEVTPVQEGENASGLQKIRSDAQKLLEQDDSIKIYITNECMHKINGKEVLYCFRSIVDVRTNFFCELLHNKF
jgi:hypothetical protein